MQDSLQCILRIVCLCAVFGLRSGAFWPAPVVSVRHRLFVSAAYRALLEQPGARSADPSDSDVNNTGDRTFRVKRGTDTIPYFSWGLFRETADFYYTDDYFDDESRSTTTRRLTVDRGDRPTLDPHSRIAYLGRVADLAKRAWTEAERPIPTGRILALEDHDDSYLWSKLPTTCS